MERFPVCTIDPVFEVSSARHEQATSRKPDKNTPFGVKKGAVSTIFEMSPARASQTTPQKNGHSRQTENCPLTMTPNDLMTLNDSMTLNDLISTYVYTT